MKLTIIEDNKISKFWIDGRFDGIKGNEVIYESYKEDPYFGAGAPPTAVQKLTINGKLIAESHRDSEYGALYGYPQLAGAILALGGFTRVEEFD